MSLSLDEKEEYDIFKILVAEKVESFTLKSLPQSVKDLIGKGDWVIMTKLENKGYVLDLYADKSEFEFTNAGRSRYKALRDKKRNTVWAKLAGGITLAAAIAGAVYAGLTYHGCNARKPLLDRKTQEKQQQPIPLSSDTSKMKTILVHPNDSLKPKKK